MIGYSLAKLIGQAKEIRDVKCWEKATETPLHGELRSCSPLSLRPSTIYLLNPTCTLMDAADRAWSAATLPPDPVFQAHPKCAIYNSDS